MDYSKNYGDITAQRLRELREKKGYSHSSLADEFNVKYKNLSYTDKDGQKRSISLSESALKSFEVGDKPHSKRLAGDGMGIRYLRCLADFYGVSADYLLGLNNDPVPDVNMREFKKMTGLDDGAIEFLTKLYRPLSDTEYTAEEAYDKITPCQFINDLITSPLFFPAAIMFISAVKKFNKYKKHGNPEDFDPDLPEGYVLLTDREYAAFAKNEATDKLSMALEKLWIHYCEDNGAGVGTASLENLTEFLEEAQNGIDQTTDN